MTDKVVNAFTTHQVFPKYVTDETLKRARTEDKDGNPAINIYNKELGETSSYASISTVLMCLIWQRSNKELGLKMKQSGPELVMGPSSVY